MTAIIRNAATTDALLALADRCEAATGPDRELDARIWCALNGKRYAEHWVSDYDKGTQVGFTEPPKRTVIVAKRAVPNVTASLDAALTLVPEGWDAIRIERTRLPDEAGSVGYRCEVMEIGPAVEGFVRAEALTRSLALVSAALRARAAQ